MAGVWRRKTRDGKPGKYIAWWIDDKGVRHTKTCSTSERDAERIAQKNEEAGVRLREGLISPREKMSLEAAKKPIEVHIEDYRLALLAKADGLQHTKHVAGAIKRILEYASIRSLDELNAVDRLQAALGRLHSERSPRTANHARNCIIAFVRWLEDSSRIIELPRGIKKLAHYNQKVGRRLIRSPLTVAELKRLLEVTASGPDVATKRARVGRGGDILESMSGKDRSVLYLTACSTGFRFSELASLTPESFKLDGDSPTITCAAAYTKNGALAIQPISIHVAKTIAEWIKGKVAGKPVFLLPRHGVYMIQADLRRCGISPLRPNGERVDFHSLRHTYVTNLIDAGATMKEAQKLARHSSIVLTGDIYAHASEDNLRRAVERLSQGSEAAAEKDAPALQTLFSPTAIESYPLMSGKSTKEGNDGRQAEE